MHKEYSSQLAHWWLALQCNTSNQRKSHLWSYMGSESLSRWSHRCSDLDIFIAESLVPICDKFSSVAGNLREMYAALGGKSQ